jgi:hypothetical protein
LLVRTGSELTPENNEQVLALFRQLQLMHLPGLRDLIPAYNTLALVLDPDYLDRAALKADPVVLVRHWIERALRSARLSPPGLSVLKYRFVTIIPTRRIFPGCLNCSDWHPKRSSGYTQPLLTGFTCWAFFPASLISDCSTSVLLLRDLSARVRAYLQEV